MKFTDEQYDELLEEGWKGFHDVILEVVYPEKIDITKDMCLVVFKKLPFDIQSTAFQWGMSDTPFREEAHEYIRDNMSEFNL